MSDDIKDSDSQEPSPRSGKAFAARRRVVKGMASAVPVIMTVASASAVAQARTSILNCAREPDAWPAPTITINLNSRDFRDSWEDLGNGYYVDPNGWVRKVDASSGTNNVHLNLVMVDPDGEVGGEAYPVTKSCYASFLNI